MLALLQAPVTMTATLFIAAGAAAASAATTSSATALLMMQLHQWQLPPRVQMDSYLHKPQSKTITRQQQQQQQKEMLSLDVLTNTSSSCWSLMPHALSVPGPKQLPRAALHSLLTAVAVLATLLRLQLQLLLLALRPRPC
jgi:hypothetical protein